MVNNDASESETSGFSREHIYSIDSGFCVYFRQFALAVGKPKAKLGDSDS